MLWLIVLTEDLCQEIPMEIPGSLSPSCIIIRTASSVLCRAREEGLLQCKGGPVAIFPDHTGSVTKARAMFNNVRNLLQGGQEIRYGITFPARLRTSYNGNNKDFLDPKRANAYARGTQIQILKGHKYFFQGLKGPCIEVGQATCNDTVIFKTKWPSFTNLA